MGFSKSLCVKSLRAFLLTEIYESSLVGQTKHVFSEREDLLGISEPMGLPNLCFATPVAFTKMTGITKTTKTIQTATYKGVEYH